MRILYLANNWVGWQVLKYLRQQGDEIVGLVIHPPERQKFGREILATAALPAPRIFDATTLHTRQTLRAIADLQAQLAVSVLFGYLLRAPFLATFGGQVINLHPAYLPFNKGAYPNVWSIVDRTPAGATLHYVDEGVDSGDIIAQKQLPAEPVDTGATLYKKLEQACVELFAETWPLVRTGRAPRRRQSPDEGTSHKTHDVEQIDEIDLDRSYPAGQLIDILRARTFPPCKGAYFEVAGRKVYLQLHLRYEQND